MPFSHIFESYNTKSTLAKLKLALYLCFHTVYTTESVTSGFGLFSPTLMHASTVHDCVLIYELCQNKPEFIAVLWQNESSDPHCWMTTATDMLLCMISVDKVL